MPICLLKLQVPSQHALLSDFHSCARPGNCQDHEQEATGIAGARQTDRQTEQDLQAVVRVFELLNTRLCDSTATPTRERVFWCLHLRSLHGLLASEEVRSSWCCVGS